MDFVVRRRGARAGHAAGDGFPAEGERVWAPDTRLMTTERVRALDCDDCLVGWGGAAVTNVSSGRGARCGAIHAGSKRRSDPRDFSQEIYRFLFLAENTYVRESLACS